MYIRSSSFPAVMLLMLFIYAGIVAAFKESKNGKDRKKFGSIMNDDLSRKFTKLNTSKPSVPFRKSEYDLVDEDRAKHGKLSQESRDDEKNWF